MLWINKQKTFTSCSFSYESRLNKIFKKTPENLEDTYRKIVADDILNNMKKAQATIENMGFITLFLPPEKISSSILANYLTQKSRARL